MHAASAGPTTVVLDEFPFLAKASPAIASIIQRALDPAAQRANRGFTPDLHRAAD
jgi:hypothetical protein